MVNADPQVDGPRDRVWVCDLGLTQYESAWAAQRIAHHHVSEGGWPTTILFVEHPPVVTLGKRGRDVHVLADAHTLASRGVRVVESNRGGEVTFHGPGQIVAYPIVRLARLGLGPAAYVHRLEDAIIELLARIGLAARKSPEGVGVWVDATDPETPERKIAAIGVRVSRGVSLHGLALNVQTDLSYFDLIVPCGLAARRVTSVQRETGQTPPRDDLIAMLADCLAKQLDCRWEKMPDAPTAMLAARENPAG